MLINGKIPVIVGVTGHRNIVEEDKPQIKARVVESLKEIQLLCKSDGGDDTPVVMLNAFAQGSDMLCAEVAFELGIDVYAILPCEEERYIKSFDDETDKNKLSGYLARVKRKFIAPDIEKNKPWLKEKSNIDDESYEYRQLGIYMAEHSHILIALWDGKEPKSSFGCGTVEVINFALEHKFLDKDHLFKPGTINDSAVVWIKSRRQGDGSEADIRKKWLISNLESSEESDSKYAVLDEPPQFLIDIIKQTVKYNAGKVEFSDNSTKLWNKSDDLDEYRKNIDYHYAKADELSYSKNQKMYNVFLKLIAFIGTAVACTFLIYDEASLPFMIFPCSISVGAIICLCYLGRKNAYLKTYVDYRAFAEALRIQFYTSMCLKEKEIETNVCGLYSWAQKIDSVWIDKAIRAITVISQTEEIKVATSDVIETWIGKNESPKGQLMYHSGKINYNKKQAQKYQTCSRVFRCVAVVTYFVIFAFEIVACILKARGVAWFWEKDLIGSLSCRNVCAMVLGMMASGSLLFSSYWGKLSFDRKYQDNQKMCEFYNSAYCRWNEVKEYPDGEIAKFVKEIAREEIVENGIWYSYVKDNELEVNI